MSRPQPKDYEDAYVVKHPTLDNYLVHFNARGEASWAPKEGAIRWPTKHQARAARDATDDWQLSDREPERDEGLEYLGFGTPCGYRCPGCNGSLTDRRGLVQPLGHRFTVCTTCAKPIKWFVRQLPNDVYKLVKSWIGER